MACVKNEAMLLKIVNIKKNKQMFGIPHSRFAIYTFKYIITLNA